MKFVCLIAGLALAGAATANAQAPAGPAITAESTSPVVKGKDLPITDVAIWMENGKPMIARGPDAAKAPKDAHVLHTRVFNLGNGQLYREISMPKGMELPAPKNGITIVYVVKGHLKIQLGKETAEVGPGDAWRKIAPQDNKYTALDDVTFVETDVP